MNGRCIGHYLRLLKVMIAHSKDQGSSQEYMKTRDFYDCSWLFYKDFSESLKRSFDTFGTVQYVKESKGFAYIKFYWLVHADKVFKSCNKSNKAVFAELRPPRYHDDHHNLNCHSQTTSGFQFFSNRSSTCSRSYFVDYCRLIVHCSLAV